MHFQSMAFGILYRWPHPFPHTAPWQVCNTALQQALQNQLMILIAEDKSVAAVA